MSNYQLERKQRVIDRLKDENDRLRRNNQLLKSAIDIAIVYLDASPPKVAEARAGCRLAQMRYPFAWPWDCEVTRKDCEIFEAAE